MVYVPPHRDDPARLRHLIIYFSESWSHLVGEGARHYHTVRLTLWGEGEGGGEGKGERERGGG